MPAGCGFCGSAGVTKEHIWPNWLRRLILESRAASGMKKFHAEIERNGTTQQYKNPKLEQRVGMPCSACNGGWMSVLENEVKDFMATMVSRGEIVLLTPERQVAVSRWAMKTAMVYEFTSAADERKYFSDGERLAFKERFELPENLWIWAGRYDGVRAMHADQRRSPKGTPRIYSLTLTANFLTLQLFAYRESEGDLAQMANATISERLLQLWPPAPDWLSWPPPTTIDDDALEVLDDRFVKFLAQAAKNFTERF